MSGGQLPQGGFGSPTMQGYGFNWYGGQPLVPEGGYYNQMAQMMAGPSYAPVGSNWFSGNGGSMGGKGASPLSAPGIAGKGAAPQQPPAAQPQHSAPAAQQPAPASQPAQRPVMADPRLSLLSRAAARFGGSLY